MTEHSPGRPGASGPGLRRSSLRAASRPVVPLWQTAFRDPVVDGHIRLQGLSWTERQAARLGLVTLGLLLLSILFVEVWRRGTLLPIGDGEALTFLPVGLMPVTLVTFLVAWTMLAWGALTAGWPVKVFVALAFLLTNASLATAAAIEVGDRAALTYGPDLIRGAYFATPAVLVLALALPWLPAKVASRVLPVLRLVTLSALAVFFLTHLWIHVVFIGEGFQGQVQFLISNAITEIDGLLLPLVFVSAVLVIDFSLDVALGVARGVHELPRRLLRWLLVVLLAVKLWFIFFDELGDWATYTQDRPVAVIRTVVSVLLLVALVRLVTRLAATDALDSAKERLLYGASVALAAPLIFSVLIVGAGIFALIQFKMDHVPGFVSASNGKIQWVVPGLAALAILAGAWLMRRRRTPMDSEFGSGLIVIGAWSLPALLLNETTFEIGFSDALVDVLITFGAVAVLVRHWNRIDLRLTIVLAAVTVFTWLALTKGDWINLIGALFGLPAILVVVVGVVFSLAGDAGFTAGSSRLVPQGARVLLFVGYLVLSVTILHWVEATHAPSSADFQGDTAFFFIGIPWAAWLVGRRLLHLEDEPGRSVEEPAPLT